MEKYPDEIKPIFQKENKYSKGVKVELINTERAKGKYIALCDGDDYWTDPYKLQKQVDYMENHPESSLCDHGGYVVSAKDKKLLMKNRPNKGNKTFTVSEVIEGGGDLFLTHSMLYPAKFEKKRPAFFEKTSVGNHPLAFSLHGSVHYIDKLMSAYRVGDTGSWTYNNLSNIYKKKKHYNEIVAMLDELNQYTNQQYNDVINRTKNRTQFFLLLEQGKLNEAKKGEFKELYLKLGLGRKFVFFAEKFNPGILKVLRMTKRIFV